MKTCPQCKSVFSEDYVFCMNDGTTLADESVEQVTVVKSKMKLSGETSALSPEMLLICSKCELANRANSKFCKKCGNTLSETFDSSESSEVKVPLHFPRIEIQPNQSGNINIPSNPQDNSGQIGETVAIPNINATPTSTPNPSTPNYPSARIPTRSGFDKSKILILEGVLGALIIGGIAYIYMNQPHASEAKLDKAINNDQILEPAEDNAFELYHQLKDDGVDEKILKRFEDRLVLLLSEKTKDILKSVTDPGFTESSKDKWEESAKMLEWASEMNPADKKIEAKAAYSRGRIKYLAGDIDSAVQMWEKSADFDKDWALPANGLGLIYNKRKDFETARSWLNKAVQREPTWAIPYSNLGTSFYLQKRYADAAAQYQKALEYSPLWARPHAWLASIAMKNYDCGTAAKHFERVLASDAIGNEEMNLQSIRKQQQEAVDCNYYNEIYDEGYDY